MAEKQRNNRIGDIVVNMYRQFVSEVDPKNVFDLLIQKRVVTIEQKQEIENKVTTRDRCRALLEHLFCCSKDDSFIVLREALEEHYHWIVERIDQYDTESETSKVLDAKSSKLVESRVFVIGISHGESVAISRRDVVKINLNQSDDSSNTIQIPAQMNIESAAAVYGNSIFVTGVGQISDEIWRLDATSSNWTKCASLVQRRRRHCVAFVGHILYICGGWVDTHILEGSPDKTLDDVEAYDVRENKRASVGKLALAVESSGNCVPFKSSLYIFGGNGAGVKPLGIVQVYDTKTHACTLLSPPFVFNNYLRAVLWKSTAILVGPGGSCTYDFETGVWKERNKLKTGDVYYGLAICNDIVFVIGGGHCENNKWNCRGDVRCVPVVNILNDEPIDLEPYATLRISSLVYAFGQVDLEP